MNQITIEQAARGLRAAWLEHSRRDVRLCLDYSKPSDRALYDRIKALEYTISTQVAQTPLEAMMQVVLISDLAIIMAGGDRDFEEFGHQVTRMAYSVMAFMERESGVPRRHACGRLYMSDRFDPWRGPAVPAG